jgi:PAS domain S-box-containing protein
MADGGPPVSTDDARELAQTLFEEMGDAAFVVDPDSLRVLDVNPMARRLTALPRDALLRTPFPDLIRADAADALDHLGRALHTTQTFHSREGFHLRRGGGEWTPVNLTLTRLHTERKPLGLVLARDVTEQHRVREQLRQANAELELRVRTRTVELEQLTLNLRATVAAQEQAAVALRASEERFRLLVEGVSDHAVVMLDPAGGVVTWNAGAERLHGFAAEDIVGRPFATLFTPEEAQAGKPEEELRRAAAEGAVKEEGWRVRKGGERFWANGTLTALYHPDGRVRGFAKITRDLTDRVRAEERVRRSEEQFRAFMDHSPAVAWITTADGRVVYASETYRRTFFPAVDDLTGQAVAGLYPAEVARGYLDAIAELARTGRAVEVTESGVRADGTPCEFLVYKFPLPDHGEKLVGGVAIDVTARKEAAEAQARLEGQLRQAQKMEAVGRLAGASPTTSTICSP